MDNIYILQKIVSSINNIIISDKALVPTINSMGWDNGEIISFFIDEERGSKWLTDLLKVTQMVNSAFLLTDYKHICTNKY